MYKNAIHAQIFIGPPNNISPVTSNNIGHLPNLDYATLKKKGFYTPPLPHFYRIGAIYNICLKMIYLDHFIPYYVKLGEQAHIGIEES